MNPPFWGWEQCPHWFLASHSVPTAPPGEHSRASPGNVPIAAAGQALSTCFSERDVPLVASVQLC